MQLGSRGNFLLKRSHTIGYNSKHARKDKNISKIAKFPRDSFILFRHKFRPFMKGRDMLKTEETSRALSGFVNTV